MENGRDYDYVFFSSVTLTLKDKTSNHHQSRPLPLEDPKMAAVQVLRPTRPARAARRGKALRALCPVSGPVPTRRPALLLAARPAPGSPPARFWTVTPPRGNAPRLKIAPALAGRAARRREGGRAAGVGVTSLGTFWKRGGAAPRQQLENPAAGLPASSGPDFPERTGVETRNAASQGSDFILSLSVLRMVVLCWNLCVRQ